MDKIKNVANKGKESIKNISVNKKLSELLGENNIIKYGLYAIIGLTLFFILLYITYKLWLKRKNNKEMESSLKQIPTKIVSIPFNKASNPLRDYYICSSYKLRQDYHG